MSMKPTQRNITFRGAGDHDVSEVIISNTAHEVEQGPIISRVTYTISYPLPKLAAPSSEDIEMEVAESITSFVNAKVQKLLPDE